MSEQQNPEDELSETDHQFEECDHPQWASIGTVISNGNINRVWRCVDCPAWTRNNLGTAWEVPYYETPMYDGES